MVLFVLVNLWPHFDFPKHLLSNRKWCNDSRYPDRFASTLTVPLWSCFCLIYCYCGLYVFKGWSRWGCWEHQETLGRSPFRMYERAPNEKVIKEKYGQYRQLQKGHGKRNADLRNSCRVSVLKNAKNGMKPIIFVEEYNLFIRLM